MLSENLAREASNKVVERFNVTFSAIDRRQRDALLAISQVWDSRYFEEPWPTVSVAESAPDCTGAGGVTRAGEGNHAL